MGEKEDGDMSTMTQDQPKTEVMAAALEEIRKMAMEHPCFDADCFKRRDIDGLCNQGGDICDWTMVAIHADDALRANAQAEAAAE
jgi:hypothetical protein